MLAAQKSHKKKQAIAEDAIVGSRCCVHQARLWRCRFSESLNKHYVEMDFTEDIASLQAKMTKDDGGVYADDVIDVQEYENVTDGEQDGYGDA